MPKRLKLDITDPANPYGKVNTIEIECSIQYTGPEAWNQNILLPRLETFLRQNGYDLRGYKPKYYWDKDMKEIPESEFKEYIYARHGHGANMSCSSCPDPLKWREVEKMQRRIQQENGGKVAKKKKCKERRIYIMETKEERAIRKKVNEGKIDINGVDLVEGGGHRIEEY